MRRWTTLAVLALAVAGCESDEAKLDRLRTEATITDLRASAASRAWDSLRIRSLREGDPVSDSVARVWRDSITLLRDRALIAERDLQRFMR